MTEITIDLPVPPLVNQTRRIDREGSSIAEHWKDQAHRFVMAQRIIPTHRPILPLSRFAVSMVLSEEHTRCDLDAPIKSCLDYLRRIAIIKDDSQKHFRELLVRWGEAPEGCRVILRPVG